MLLATQLNFILHYNDKTDIFLRLKTWLPITHVRKKKFLSPRISHFNVHMQICKARILHNMMNS